MKRNRRVVVYVILGIILALAAVVLLILTRLHDAAALALASLVFTISMVLLLLAKTTQTDGRIRALEEFQRQASCRERAQSHDAGEGEKEEPENV